MRWLQAKIVTRPFRYHFPVPGLPSLLLFTTMLMYSRGIITQTPLSDDLQTIWIDIGIARKLNRLDIGLQWLGQKQDYMTFLLWGLNVSISKTMVLTIIYTYMHMHIYTHIYIPTHAHLYIYVHIWWEPHEITSVPVYIYYAYKIHIVPICI